jgi:hypothetical protein
MSESELDRLRLFAYGTIPKLQILPIESGWQGLMRS